MSLLGEIVRSVLVIIIVASLMEMILPDGKLRPFVRFALGLFIIVIVLSQVAHLPGKNQVLPVIMWAENTPPGSSDLGGQGQLLNEKIITQAGQQLQGRLEDQINATVNLTPGIKEAKTLAVIDKNGLLQSLEVHIVLEDGAKAEETSRKVRQFIEDFYGFQNINIAIKIGEG